MSQASLIIANVSRAIYRALSNDRAAALASFQAGNAAPATPVAGMFWLDTSTTPATLKQRNVANNAWGPPLLQFATGATADTDTTLPLNKATALALFGSSLPDFAAGVSGQPRILADAFPDFAAGAVEIINFTMPAGTVLSKTKASGSNGQNKVQALAPYQAIKAGTLRMSIEMRKWGSYTAGADGFHLLKNGAEIAALMATNSWATYTTDFTFSAGDEISAQISVSSSTLGSGSTEYRNLRLLGDQRGLFRL